jgi:hypothetical protein
VEFVISPPDIVRSINQASLLQCWMRWQIAGRLPLLESRALEELTVVSDNLLFTDVVNGAGSARFLIRFSGVRILEYFGVSCATQGQGRFLDEVLPAAYCKAALSSFHEAVEARQPVYTIADMRDRAGRIVHFERLLLPLSRTGTAVDRILASIEAVSPEGKFNPQDLVTMPAAPPAFAFCAVIDTGGSIADDCQ